jgi:hypothetical protein
LFYFPFVNGRETCPQRENELTAPDDADDDDSGNVSPNKPNEGEFEVWSS